MSPGLIEERKAALNAVLESKEFSRTPALAKLLTYLCERTFEGREHEIKEYSIATEVYGRSDTFGERRDSVVRVEVSRLRKRLLAYYESEGAHHDLKILIPAGTYQPVFETSPSAPLVEPALQLDESPQGPSEPPAVKAEPESALQSPNRKGTLDADSVVRETLIKTRVLWIAIPALLSLIVLWIALWQSRQQSKALDAAPSGTNPVATATGPGVTPAASDVRPVRILAGSFAPKSVDRFGVEWMGDRYFVGGEQNRWEFGGKEMGVPIRTIRWAPDQLYFRSFRFGNFSYRIPLPPGKYEMRLYFSEVIFMPTEFGDGVENRRIFDVVMNGQPLLSSFDIAADAGGANIASIRAFSNVSPVDGFLTLDFRPILSGAWLNAIEIIPNNTGQPLPIRVVTRNGNLTDQAGNLWEVDRYYNGGRQISDGEVVSGSKDPDLFLWQRYGSFTYRFPVPAGKYKLRLLFAETFFGPHNRGKGGPGSRIFNVYSGGSTLLRNFEIFKEAGESHAIEKVFRGLTPTSQGRIEVTFESVVQYAMVNALELTPEH